MTASDETSQLELVTIINWIIRLGRNINSSEAWLESLDYPIFKIYTSLYTKYLEQLAK